jgi:hypothetical protein
MLSLVLATLTAQANPYAVPVAVRPAPRSHRVAPARPAEAMRACNDAFWSGRQQAACRTVVRHHEPVRAARVVQRCAGTFWNAADKLRCVESVVASPVHRPGRMIATCGDTFWSGPDKLACIELTARRPAITPDTLRACSDAFWAADRKLTCAATAGTVSFGSESVRRCTTTTWDPHGRMQCIVAETTPRPRRHRPRSRPVRRVARY